MDVDALRQALFGGIILPPRAPRRPRPSPPSPLPALPPPAQRRRIEDAEFKEDESSDDDAPPPNPPRDIDAALARVDVALARMGPVPQVGDIDEALARMGPVPQVGNIDEALARLNEMAEVGVPSPRRVVPRIPIQHREELENDELAGIEGLLGLAPEVPVDEGIRRGLMREFDAVSRVSSQSSGPSFPRQLEEEEDEDDIIPAEIGLRLIQADGDRELRTPSHGHALTPTPPPSVESEWEGEGRYTGGRADPPRRDEDAQREAQRRARAFQLREARRAAQRAQREAQEAAILADVFESLHQAALAAQRALLPPVQSILNDPPRIRRRAFFDDLRDEAPSAQRRRVEDADFKEDESDSDSSSDSSSDGDADDERNQTPLSSEEEYEGEGRLLDLLKGAGVSHVLDGGMFSWSKKKTPLASTPSRSAFDLSDADKAFDAYTEAEKKRREAEAAAIAAAAQAAAAAAEAAAKAEEAKKADDLAVSRRRLAELEQERKDNAAWYERQATATYRPKYAQHVEESLRQSRESRGLEEIKTEADRVLRDAGEILGVTGPKGKGRRRLKGGRGTVDLLKDFRHRANEFLRFLPPGHRARWEERYEAEKQYLRNMRRRGQHVHKVEEVRRFVTESEAQIIRNMLPLLRVENRQNEYPAFLDIFTRFIGQINEELNALLPPGVERPVFDRLNPMRRNWVDALQRVRFSEHLNPTGVPAGTPDSIHEHGADEGGMPSGLEIVYTPDSHLSYASAESVRQNYPTREDYLRLVTHTRATEQPPERDIVVGLVGSGYDRKLYDLLEGAGMFHLIKGKGKEDDKLEAEAEELEAEAFAESVAEAVLPPEDEDDDPLLSLDTTFDERTVRFVEDYDFNTKPFSPPYPITGVSKDTAPNDAYINIEPTFLMRMAALHIFLSARAQAIRDIVPQIGTRVSMTDLPLISYEYNVATRLGGFVGRFIHRSDWENPYQQEDFIGQIRHWLEEVFPYETAERITDYAFGSRRFRKSAFNRSEMVNRIIRRVFLDTGRLPRGGQ